MKIAILGSGAMGSLYGTYLSKQNDVTLIDSYKAQVDAINNLGLTMVEGEKSETNRIKCVLSGTDIGVQDLVIVFVKSISTREAVMENRAIIGPGTLVVTLQNGAGNDREISEVAKGENIVIGTSQHNSVSMGLGKFKHTASGVTTIGTYITNHRENLKGEDAELYHKGRRNVEVVAGVLISSGLEVKVSDDIQRIIWSKLFVNMSINTISALLGCKIGYMAENKYAWDFAKRIVYEGVMVAEADGTYFDRREALEAVRSVCVKAGNGYASMYQDRVNKRRTEIDKINGAVVEQAKLYGVATPYNSLIVDLIHAIEGTYLEEK